MAAAKFSSMVIAPLALLIMGIALQWLFPSVSHLWAIAAFIGAALTFIIAVVIAIRSEAAMSNRRGGKGGRATAEGDGTSADGGAGGASIGGQGGDGGNAVAKGKGSRAVGGRGGDA